IVVFMLFYWILKYIFQFIFFGIPWFIIIRPIVKDKTKNRILGGLMGAARGAFSGFISIFPMLILMNTIIGQGVVIDDPDYQDLAAYISEANQYNAVRYINDAVQVEEKGLADYVFDLAFSSKVDEDTIITWRSELSWIGEGAKAALPYFLGEEFDTNNITLADVQRFDTFFQAFAESNLLNAALKPGIKAGIMFANGGETPFLTEAEIDEIILKVNGINLDLTNDLQEVYTAVKELLEVQNMNAWMTIADNPGVIGTFDENQQNLITSALTRIATLDLVKLGDVALEGGIYQQAVLDQISWLESDQEKINLLTGVLDKIRAYDGEFISTVLTDVVDLLDSVLFQFPGIDTNNDGVTDITLSDFLERINEMTVILNKDPEYHSWFQGAL